MGMVKPLLGKSKKYWIKKKAKSEKKIAYHKEVVKICDENINKN